MSIISVSTENTWLYGKPTPSGFLLSRRWRLLILFTTTSADMFVCKTIQRIFVFLPFCKMEVPFSCCSFFRLPAEWSESSAFNFFFFSWNISKTKNKNKIKYKSTGRLQKKKKKKKKVVSIPYLWCSKTESSLSREWVAGSVARLGVTHPAFPISMPIIINMLQVSCLYAVQWMT